MVADLELCAVAKHYAGFSAVAGVDLRIGAGEFFSLLGPSGCGKTTTLRMVAGFVRPSAGRILLDGRDIADAPPERRPVNMVFQSYALFPHMTVTDNIAFGLRSRGLPRQTIRARVADAVSMARLEGLEQRHPRELSGGQQQRVALARALVNRPEVLLLDEPLGALDLRIRRHMQIELKRIQREVGITFVYVTHDQEEALSLSDRIGVMHQGRLEQVATPEALYASPASLFVAGFIGEMNLWPGVVAGAAAGEVAVRLASGETVRAPQDGRAYAAGDRVTVAVRPEHLSIAEEPAGPAGNAIMATITGTSFQGLSRAVFASGGGGLPLQLHLSGDAAAGAPAPGQPVRLCWRPSVTRLFPAAPQ
ncbi:MAG: ABC transporter ATP-binding protein [Dongiaceae bacterium]